jgi:hypothetical protein
MKWVAIAAVVSLLHPRPFMQTHPVSLQERYEAAAHIVVGGVIGAWLINSRRWRLVPWRRFQRASAQAHILETGYRWAGLSGSTPMHWTP